MAKQQLSHGIVTEPMTPEERRDARLMSTYGISELEYLMMEAAQSGVCAICARPPQPRTVLVVDHNHESGVVRGLLCSDCNTGIGLLHDDPVLLRAAIAYLVLHGHYIREEQVAGTAPDAVSQSHPDLKEKTGAHLTIGHQTTSGAVPKLSEKKGAPTDGKQAEQ
jgi:hypothetical protein